MTNKMLVAYATNAGSTVEVAEAVGKALAAGGMDVDVKDIGSLDGIDGYEAFVFAAPMIIGWHKGMRDYLKANQGTLADKPVAYLITLLNMLKTDEKSFDGVPIFQDPAHGKVPANPAKLNPAEKHGTLQHLVGDLLEEVPAIKPVSVGLFGGTLDMSKLNLFGKLFIRIIIRYEEGDYRNWDAINEWAGSLPAMMG
jgi:menaquinone-dependent protoporphyrinogen IX oxidase